MKGLALVTGGTRGIGKAICLGLKSAGFTVIANYGGNDVSAKNFTEETGIEARKWDVSSFDQCQQNVAKIEEQFGRPISVLVNNAGITRDSFLHKKTPIQWNEVIDTNLTSCYNMSHAVVGKMRDTRFGRIINISSINALKGQLGQTNYSAAKAGMIGFTKALAREVANKNVTVNAIAPGYINTDMVTSMNKDVLEQIVANIPVGRLGEPEEVARVVTFLADHSSGFITGETINVNGGDYMA